MTLFLLFKEPEGAGAVTGDLAATEAPDVAAMAGAVLVAGSLAATEATDTAALVGDVVVSGTIAVTEATDTAALAGDVVVAGALAVTEAADTLAADGIVQDALITGTLAAVEAADAVSAAGAVLVAGALAATEPGADSMAAAGVVPIAGTLVSVEAQDVAALQGAVLVAGALAVAEAPDTFAAGPLAPEADSPSGGIYILRPPSVYGTAFLVAPAVEFAGVGRVIPQIRGTGRLSGYPATVRGQGEQDFTALEDEELEWIERAGGLDDPPRERCDVCEATRLREPGARPGSHHAAREERHADGRGGARRAAEADRQGGGGRVRGRTEDAPLPGLLDPWAGCGGRGVPGRAALTPRQEELLALIQESRRALGEAPSARALARRLGLHHSRVQQLLAALHDRGVLVSPSPEGLPAP